MIFALDIGNTNIVLGIIDTKQRKLSLLLVSHLTIPKRSMNMPY